MNAKRSFFIFKKRPQTDRQEIFTLEGSSGSQI